MVTVQPGTVIGGRYRVREVLGRGGMGSVYRVTDEPSRRDLALKLADPRAATDGELRFRREFHTMANLRHPRIVAVYDYGIDAAGSFYTMELLDGRDLRDERPTSISATCAIVRDVAGALAFIHSRHLIHRDVSPRNVRYTADGRAKLIDFGILASPGVCPEVAGTPPFIAPESGYGLPLDHRADVFALGALAYWLLAGRHAFPARQIDELAELWRHAPALPSASRADVPAALDELVIAMLSIDPLARPRSAAEVIERLDAILGSGPDGEVEVARGYLASASFVGRRDQMRRLRRYLDRASSGTGRAEILEAPSGMGKTRLLRELHLEAQLRGATVIEVSGDAAGRGPYGVAAELARAVLRAMPAELETLRPHANVLIRVMPELPEHVGKVSPAPPHPDPAEERMRIQATLVDWLADIARRRFLVIEIDDVQRCDEASAAALAALAHTAPQLRLVLCTSLRTDEPIRARPAIAAIRDASRQLRLEGLGPDDVEELIRTVFGEVLHVGRLAHWMQQLAAGSPLHCIELARLLVDRQVIRYAGGEWLVPENIGEIELPEKLATALEQRIARLAGPARALAEAMSVHGGEISLATCQVLADDPDEERLFGALDELLFQEVLLTAGGTYEFRHDGLREALLRTVEPGRRKQLHLRVARALAGADTPELEAEIGWHLLAGDEIERGAALLERAGTRLFDAQSFFESIRPLECALEIYEARGQRPRARLRIKEMLVTAGLLGDHKVVKRHAAPAIASLFRAAGLHVAVALRFLGRPLALGIGMTVAFARWLVTGFRGPSPVQSLRSFILTTNAASAAYALMLEIDTLRELIPKIRPIAVFRRRIPYAVYLLSRSLIDLALAQFRQVRDNTTQILDILARDRITPISDLERRTTEAVARYLRVLMLVSEQDPAYADELVALERLEMRHFDLGALQARVAYHRSRGEEQAAKALEGKAELLFIQLGSAWQMDAWLTVVSAMAYGITRDVMGLKHTIAALARLSGDGFNFEPILHLIRGEYHRERGELELSRQALERALEALPPEVNLLRQPALAALAETLLASGELARAREVAERGLALASDPSTGMIANRLRCLGALALIEATSGEHAAAARRLDDAIAEAAPLASPSLCGGLAEARARVAIAENDEPGFRRHLDATEGWFSPTHNPALIARHKRLALAWTIRGGEPTEDALRDAVTTIDSPAGKRDRIASILVSCRGKQERCARVLEILLDHSAGDDGFLFLVAGDTVELAAQTSAAPPVPEVEDAIRRTVAAGTVEGSQTSASHDGSEWRCVLLWRGDGEQRVVGAAAIREGAAGFELPARDVLEQLARAVG